MEDWFREGGEKVGYTAKTASAMIILLVAIVLVAEEPSKWITGSMDTSLLCSEVEIFLS